MLNRFCTVAAMTLKPLQPKSVMLTLRTLLRQRFGRGVREIRAELL
jgi:hypothetical protein